jgi:hypothetical protein
MNNIEAYNSKQGFEYGLKGISKIFGCSIPTAKNIKKSGKINAAIHQIGRKIVIDAVLALELTKKNRNTDALDKVLDATCEVMQIERDKVTSKHKGSEKHKNARIVFCHAAMGKFTYNEIGLKINRRKQQVGSMINNSNMYLEIQTAIKEVQQKLNMK